jgi:hypothetical protein
MAIKWLEYQTQRNIDTILRDMGLSRNAGAFSDTNCPYILAAAALGITQGVAPGIFDPDGQFSRAMAATMVMRTARLSMDIIVSGDILKLFEIEGLPIWWRETPPPSGFADLDEADAWARDGINFCYAYGIMRGTGDNPPIFSPNLTFTRQESMTVFNRM